MSRILVFGAAFAAASALAPGLAQAASTGYCHHFADLAVAQFRWNREIPGCFHGADPRWSLDWERHYDWRLGADYWAA